VIFVDTGAWFAVAVENDPDHAVPEKRFMALRRSKPSTKSLID